VACGSDPAAFGLFYARYFEPVLAFFAIRVRGADVAADLAAETFAAALHASRRYRRGPEPAAAWLFAIARHKLIDATRRGVVADRARRRLGIEPVMIDDEDLERIEDLADVAASGERALMSLMGELPAAQREAIVARVLEERDYDEIAGELRCSPAVVRQRVSRGLATLRTQLEEGCR